MSRLFCAREDGRDYAGARRERLRFCVQWRYGMGGIVGVNILLFFAGAFDMITGNFFIVRSAGDARYKEMLRLACDSNPVE